MDENIEILQNIQMLGNEWLLIDQEIQDVKDEMKNLNNKKKELTDNIISKMRTNNVKSIPIKGGYIEHINKPIPGPLNKENIKKNINKCINDTNKANEITEFIFLNKDKINKDELKKKIKM